MPNYTIKDILAALTCDSSRQGCDPDWRAEVLGNADPEKIKRVKNWLGQKPGELPRETASRLRLEAKIR